MMVLTKRLACGHERIDAFAQPLGASAHCSTCRNLRDIVEVGLARETRMTNYYRAQLAAVGFTRDEIKRMEKTQPPRPRAAW